MIIPVLSRTMSAERVRPTATGNKASANEERFGLSKVPEATSKLIILVVTFVSILCARRQKTFVVLETYGSKKRDRK